MSVTMSWMTSSPSSTRRERLRAEALDEIREHGYAQIAQGGPTALSLNGIAKAMGMSGPAMYRYFASRDALLATLVTESYEELADALDAAAQDARRRAPEGRLRATAHAFRDWALAQPHRYRLVFGSTYGSGALDPERIVPAAQRSMHVFLAAIADLQPTAGGPPPRGPLGRELASWGKASGEPFQSGVLLMGLTAWTRLHGLVSLEIEGTFAQMGLDPARLYDAELDHVIAQCGAPT
jgi:AcrR family transcriptional regulator